MSSSSSAELPTNESHPLDGSGGESDGDDPPRLSSHALAALQEFYSEQQSVLLGGEAAEAAVISENWVNY